MSKEGDEEVGLSYFSCIFLVLVLLWILLEGNQVVITAPAAATYMLCGMSGIIVCGGGSCDALD